ncbi:MAG: metalloregulator ArsR/SmtB family transcription factor [Myxococcota bacterium]|nr:metalloregulator ArsR/SmtB family transcription factor [Myxococcota bacterium]
MPEPHPDLDATLAALADPTRRQVIERLIQRPHRAGELAEAFEMSPPAMSRHLRVLRTHGLVEEDRVDDDARVRLYRLRPEPFQDLKGWLQEVERFWTGKLAAFKAHAESPTRKSRSKSRSKRPRRRT